MRRLLAILLATTLGATGCATSGSGGGGSSGGSRDHIVEEELTDPAIQSLNAEEAIERLRPSWLRARGDRLRPVVYLNGSRYGDLRSLSQIPVAEVEEMRFIDPRDATTRYGTGVPGGVIAIETRR